MGSCAAPSAKGDDKFITTDYLQQCLYHGMRIELKEPNGKAPTKEQIAWMRRLREEGYYVVLAYGAEQAITAILEYISLKKGEAIEHVLNGDKWLYAA